MRCSEKEKGFFIVYDSIVTTPSPYHYSSSSMCTPCSVVNVDKKAVYGSKFMVACHQRSCKAMKSYG